MKTSEKIKLHEDSSEHFTNLKAWTELRVKLVTNQTIDKEFKNTSRKILKHWKQLIIRIISIIKRLATNNLTFPGTKFSLTPDLEIFRTSPAYHISRANIMIMYCHLIR